MSDKKESPVVQSLAEMIAACRFDRWPPPEINETNLPRPAEIADASLMLTIRQKDLGGRTMTTAEIQAGMARTRYHPANLYELLAYAKNRWSSKSLTWIVALGSSWTHHDQRSFPYLSSDVHSPGLRLFGDDAQHRWYEYYQFLVVLPK